MLLTCAGQSSCSIKVNGTSIIDQCQYNAYVNDYLYASYQCYDRYVALSNNSLTRGVVSYVVVVIDFIGIIILLSTLILIKRDQGRVKKLFLENYISISHYTVHLKNMSIKKGDLYQTLNDLILHLQKVLKDEVSFNEVQFYEPTLKLNSGSFIYDINYPIINTSMLHMLLEKEELVKNHEDCVKNYYHFKRISNQKKTFEYSNKVKILKEKIVKLQYKMSQYREEDDIDKIEDLYLTFTDIKRPQYFTEIYRKNKCTRCCYIFCCQSKKIKHLYFKGEWLDVNYSPDVPSNIKWQNMTYPKCKSFMLKLVSIIISLIVIIAGLAVIVYGKQFQNSLNDQFDNNINCNFIDYTTNSVMTEYQDNTLSNRAKVQVYCFCSNLFKKQGYTTTFNYLFSNISTYPCRNWMIAYFQYLGMNYGIIITIPIINAVLKTVIELLTQLEKNKSVVTDKLSNLIKISIAQFFNSAISILIINARVKEVIDFDKTFPVFTGLYPDFNSAWFYDVGTTIVFAMVLNVFLPHVGNLLFACFTCCRRVCESGNLNGKHSKIFIRSSFNSLYVGPEYRIDLRYAAVQFSWF